MLVINDTFVRPNGASYSRLNAVSNMVNLNWNISFLGANSLSYALYGLSNLEYIDTANWDVSNITDFSGLFQGCSKLANLDVSNWNMQKAINLSNMFVSTGIQNIDLFNWNLINAKDLSRIFWGRYGLVNFNAPYNWNLSNVTNLSYAFSQCHSLTTLDASQWQTNNLKDTSYAFSDMYGGTNYLNLASWNMWKAENVEKMFFRCQGLKNLNVAWWEFGPNVSNLSYFLANCFEMNNLNIQQWKTSYVQNFSHMLEYDTYLKTLNMNDWLTGWVNNISSMFCRCYNLTDVNVLNWNTTNFKDMSCMFQYCSKLRNINISKWNLCNVTNMRSAFSYCDGLSYNTNSLKGIAQALLTATNVPSTDKNLYIGNSMGPLYGCAGQINNTSVGTDLVTQLRAAGWSVSE